MKRQDLKYLQSKVENEGFDYCFIHYSDFKDIQDEKFHELRVAYLKAHRELSEYLKIEDA